MLWICVNHLNWELLEKKNTSFENKIINWFENAEDDENLSKMIRLAIVVIA